MKTEEIVVLINKDAFEWLIPGRKYPLYINSHIYKRSLGGVITNMCVHYIHLYKMTPMRHLKLSLNSS